MSNGRIRSMLKEAEGTNFWGMGVGMRPILADFYGSDVSKIAPAIQSILRLRVPLEQLRLSMVEKNTLAIMAKGIDSVAQADPSVATYLAIAIAKSRDSEHQRNLSELLDIVHSIELCGDEVLESVAWLVSGCCKGTNRLRAIEILVKRRCSSEMAIYGLISASHDTADLEGRVAVAAVKAFGSIGLPWCDIADAVLYCTYNVCSEVCGEALTLMATIHGRESETLITAALRVAISEFTPWSIDFKSDPGTEEYALREEAMYRTYIQNQGFARDLLRRGSFSTDDISLKNAHNHRASPEEKIILAWFSKVDLDTYRTALQVFWCIGKIEHHAFANHGAAMGWHKLHEQLRATHPQFKYVDLPIGVTFLHRDCIPSIDALFDREPFYSQAWLEQERGMELRPEVMRGRRREAVWTQKAFRAWHYTNVFLKLQDLLPTLGIEKLD